MSGVSYGIIAPFLPFTFQEKQINQAWIGYIFASYSIGVITASPLVHRLIQKFGRRNLIVAGMLLMGFAFIMLGFISAVQNKAIYVCLAILMRFVQGFTDGLILTTCRSVALNRYPENRNQLIGYFEAVQGFGLFVGPGIGSILYAMKGADFVFISFGSCFILFTGVCSILLDKSIDQNIDPN